MLSDITFIVNSVSTGIIFCSTITIFLIGWKYTSTRFFAIFWLAIFFFSFSYLLHMKYPETYPVVIISQFFIPAFYLLYLLVYRKEIFHISHISIFILPLSLSILYNYFVILDKNGINYIIYHLVVWPVLMIYTSIIYSRKRKEENSDNSEKNIIMTIITSVSVMPFILVNFILAVITKNSIVIVDVLPPCLAAASFLMLYFTFKKHILVIDKDHSFNMNFLKTSLNIEKRTLVEKLSANLIHEIKNPITAIQSLNQQLLKRSESMESWQVKKYLTIMESELKRLKELSESYLKNISTNDEDERSSIKLTDTLNSISKLFVFEFNKKGIDLSIDNAVSESYVSFNENHLRQILINLIYNAIQADATIIKIYCNPDNKTDIFIEDNGKGIKEADRNLLFKPFFSTKHDGTGLGLSICKEILNENLGDITLVESLPGKTVFKLVFNNNNTTKEDR